MTEMKLPSRVLSKEEVTKIHIQLGHCSENTLVTTIRAAQMHCYLVVIQDVLAKCGCQTAVRRITPPVVASTAAKYNGEIIALDIIFPFTNCFDGRISKEHPALFMIDSLSRFVNCTLLVNRASGYAAQVFINDWVRTLGKPRRIITDRGGPTLQGDAWAELSDIYGWEMIHAPRFAPHQNGIAERSTRSLKIAVGNLTTATNTTDPAQDISTQSAIAKNHVPHSVTGIPPAMAMTGRCDILAGHGYTALTHDPNAFDSLIRVTNNMNNILNARNAIIVADASYAIKTMLSRKSPDRFMTHFVPGVAVQIAIKQTWVGTYRVVSVLGSNLILDRANKLFKWPKNKTRVIHELEGERFDHAVIVTGKKDPTREVANLPPPLGGEQPASSSSNIPSRRSDAARKKSHDPLTGRFVKSAPGPPEADGSETDLAPLSELNTDVVGLISTQNAIQFLAEEMHHSCGFNDDLFCDSKSAPNLSVDIHGLVACPHHSPEVEDDLSFCTFSRYPMSHLLPIPNVFTTHHTDARINTATWGNR